MAKQNQWMRCLLGLILAGLMLGASPLRASCASPLTSFTGQELERRLNAHFRAATGKSWLGAWRRLTHGFNLIKPFRVIEREHLLPDGELPPLASLSEVIVTRMSREEGLREMKLALNRSEERAWIFVPSLELWIYYSVRDASVRHVTVNVPLRAAIVDEFGRVEEYHTHPVAAVHSARRGNPDKPQFKRDRIRFEDHAVFLLSLPSSYDFEAVWSLWDGRTEWPATDHFVVHPWGVTFYSVRLTLKRFDAEHYAFKPAPTLLLYEDLLEIRDIQPINEKIRRLADLQLRRAQASTAYKYRKLNWPDDQQPRIFIEPHLDD